MRQIVFRSSLLTALIASSAIAQRDTTFSWSKQLPAGARFAIRNLNGAIEVQPGSTDKIEVRATIRSDARGLARDLSFDVREAAPDSVVICTVDRGANACDPVEDWTDNYVSVRYVVELPKGLRLRFVTRNGNVIVMQTAKEIDAATTGSGDVVIRESEGRASASSSNGSVTVAAANGPVRATSGNGSVTVNTFRGPVAASSGNGDVDVRMISVPPLPEQGVQTMSVSSGNGDVRLTLPADFEGEFDATTGHGSIKCDFQVNTADRKDKSRLRGTVGNGQGLLIKLHSGNGKLEIRKG